MSYAQKIEALIEQRDHWESEARKISMIYDMAEVAITNRDKKIAELTELQDRYFDAESAAKEIDRIKMEIANLTSKENIDCRNCRYLDNTRTRCRTISVCTNASNYEGIAFAQLWVKKP